MGTEKKGRGAPSRYAVPLAALESEAHVAQDDMVEEIAEAPVPYAYDENVAVLKNIVGAGG